MPLDCAAKEPNKGNGKVVWTLIMIFTHMMSAALVFLVRRPQRARGSGELVLACRSKRHMRLR